MKDSILNIYRITSPTILTILLILIGNLNYNIEGLSTFIPMFTTISIFYWASYWPSLIPKWLVFLIGIFQDVVEGLPIGFSSIMLLLLWYAVVSQRKFLVKQPFWVFWGVYIVSAFFYTIVSCVLISLYYTSWMFSDEVIMLWGVSVASYPLVHALFNSFHMEFVYQSEHSNH